MKKTVFGQLSGGEEVSLYSLTNKNGMQVVLTDFGACIQSILVPDKNGKLVDVVLGYDKLSDYEHNDVFLGATIGRNANRIANARFALEGKNYQLAANDGKNNLHSGPDGYHLRFWKMSEADDEKNQVTFQLTSPAGDQGFPGQLEMTAIFQLTEKNELKISYQGLSTATTLFNPTNHSYFNLNGHDSGDILDHRLTLKASHYTPVADEAAIPTGETLPVMDSVFDFCSEKTIGQDITVADDQLRFVNGYDHNYVLDKPKDSLEAVAKAVGDKTGIQLTLLTNASNLQFYSGNSLKSVKGKNGAIYDKHAAFCLEGQYAPDAINQENFDSPILVGGSPRTCQIEFVFQCQDP